MKPTEISKLIYKAEKGTDEEAEEAMKELRKIDPTFRFCCEWDDMVINNDCPEANCCTCFPRKTPYEY